MVGSVAAVSRHCSGGRASGVNRRATARGWALAAGAVEPILHVEDDTPLREALAQALALNGRATVSVTESGAAITWLRSGRSALLLLALSMPEASGKQVVEALRARFGDGVPVVAMSAGRDVTALAARLGAWATLRKPFDLAELLAVVREALGCPDPSWDCRLRH